MGPAAPRMESLRATNTDGQVQAEEGGGMGGAGSVGALPKCGRPSKVPPCRCPDAPQMERLRETNEA
eukprot:180079-Chlamydomonas_euryale.AAC.4